MKLPKTIREIEAKANQTVAGIKSRLSAGMPARLLTVLLVGSMARPLAAQGASPWENAVSVLQASFTGPIARGLALVAIVVGGLMFAFSEGDSKRVLAGIIFGVGMAIGAVNFMSWLFPY